MQLGNGKLKVSDGDAIVLGLCNLFGAIVHCVEFSDFVLVSYGFKHDFDLLSGSQLAEVLFGNA